MEGTNIWHPEEPYKQDFSPQPSLEPAKRCTVCESAMWQEGCGTLKSVLKASLIKRLLINVWSALKTMSTMLTTTELARA